MDLEIRKTVEKYAETVKEEQLELLRALAAIPAPSHEEDLRAEFCRRWFLKNGADTVRIDPMKNVICTVNPGAEKYIVFTAHTDIVFPDKEQLPVKEDDSRMYAPGVGDDTSNLVNLLLSAKYYLTSGLSKSLPRGTGLLFVANSCEEGLGNLDGMKQLFADFKGRITQMISFDGYISQCTSRPVGSRRFEITCRTKGGHSYQDFGNPNAIVLMAELIGKLCSIRLPKEEKTTQNIGTIAGGSTVNSIAEEARILYEFRSPSEQCLEVMGTALEDAVASMEGKGGTFDIRLLGIRPGKGIVDENALRAFTNRNAEIIRRYFGGELDIQEYSSDSNIPLSIGVPANTIGTVSGGLAHTREEWIDKSSLSTGLKIALSLILEHATRL